MDYLSWPDYLILVVFLFISLGIGVYHSLTGGRQKTTTEFIIANRSLGVIPTSLSLLVSFLSAITILGVTAEMYSYGSLYLVLTPVAAAIGICLTMQVAIPWLYPLKLVSVNEYFELRFRSKSVKILATSISIFQAIMYMGAAMYAPSAALQSATGVPIVVSIPVVAVVSVAYTALGGMRAVIWTDVFQSVVMFGGLLAILIKGLVVVGGFSNVIELCSQSDRLIWTEWSPDPTERHTFWGFAFGLSITWLKVYGFSQASVQRYSATKTQSQAKLSVLWNFPTYIVLHLITCFIGLIVVAYHTSTGCDPLANHEINNANQLLPRFVLQMFADAPGFSGVFLATLYGAALSSVSSSLSGAAANCWEDILKWKLMHWTESRKALLNRFLVVLFGVAATGLAFVASALPGPITQITLSLNGATMGPVVGLFILGGLNRYANWKGALIGGITSLISAHWLIVGSFQMKRRHPTFPPLSINGCSDSSNLTLPNYDVTNSSSLFHILHEFPMNATMTYSHPPITQAIRVPLQGLENFYSISYIWYNSLWILVTVFVGSIASLLLRDPSVEEKVDEKLLINFWNCLRWRVDSESESVQKVGARVNCKTVVIFHPESTEIKKDSIEMHPKLTPNEISPAPTQMSEGTNGRRDT